MSSLPVQTPQAIRIPRAYAALGLLLFAAGLAASLGAGNAIRVDVDGTTRKVKPGTTVGEIIDAGLVAARRGDVLAAQGRRVVQRGGGTAISVSRNGREVTGARVLFDGDVVRSFDGSDTVEGVVSRELPIPLSSEFEGTGPLMTLVSPGSVGVRRVTVGAVSGDEIAGTNVVVVQATPMVIKRYGSKAGGKVVALTFDDGPWPGQTDRILAVLKQYNVRASFFMLGYLARRNSGLAHLVAAEGHLVGNHTLGHRMLTQLSFEAVDDQIERGEAAIVKGAGVTPTWFRPPGGDISPAVWSRVTRASLRVALWDVDPQDWRRPTPAQIKNNVVANVRPGSIVLLHDGGGNRESTIAALPAIIRALTDRGYRFVTLDELPVR